MTAIFDLVAQPHSSRPYVHTGFKTVLYMSTLFSKARVEVFPMSQFSSRVLWSRCFRFITIWCFQVRRLSKCNPRYLTVSTWGTTVWFIYTGGHGPRPREVCCLTAGTKLRCLISISVQGILEILNSENSAEI
jgi:hypothetical protein